MHCVGVMERERGRGREREREIEREREGGRERGGVGRKGRREIQGIEWQVEELAYAL